MASASGRRPGIGMWRMVAALVRQRRRLLLATIAVALSVGYLAGALTLLDRVSEGLSDLAAAGAERADLIVEGDVAYESALEQTRRLVPSTIADSLVGQPGIAAAVPRIQEVTVLLRPDKTPVVAPGLSEQPLGTNWPDDAKISPYRFVGEGRPPEGDDEVVIDQRSSEISGLGVGDQIGVWGKTTFKTYEIVGVVTTAEGELPNGSSLALFSTPEARSLFDMPDNDNRVAIRLEDGADRDEVAARISAQLPPGAVLVDGATGAMHRQESLTRSFALIRVLIMGFAGLALIVGMVTVANSLTLLYSERRHTFATFRLVGAKPWQLLCVALTEAAMLAGVASLIGAPLGLLLGRVIEMALGALGTSVPVGGSVVSISALLLAVVIGSIATVLAAIVPAWRACRVAPIEAIVSAEAASSPSLLHRLARASMVAIAVGAIVGGFMLIGDLAPDRALPVGVGVALLVVACAMLPTLLSVAVAAGIRAVPTRSGALRRIGARDAVRNRTRTAATTGALLLATAVVAGLAVFLSSFAASIDADVDDLVRSDLVIDSGTFTTGGLPGDLLTKVAELPDVEAVSGWQVGRAYVGQVPIRMTGIDGAALRDVLSPEWIGTAPKELTTQGVLLSENAAAQIGTSVGEAIPISFTSQGVETLTVEGIYATGSVLLGEAVIDRQVLTRQVPASTDIAGLVSLDPNSPAARASVRELAKSYGVTSVLEPSEFVNSRADLLRGFERVIQWMLLFTLLQALIGVVNTLLLSVGERRREFGLLRAAGASRRQVLRLVLVEGASFAVIGTILGLAVGVGVARAAIGALNRFGITGFEVPVPILVVTALFASCLGVLAAVVPARWAAAVPPLEAVVDSGGTSVRRSRRRSRRSAESVVAIPQVAPLPLGEPIPAEVAASFAAVVLADTGGAVPGGAAAPGGPRTTPPPLPASMLLPPPWPPVPAGEAGGEPVSPAPVSPAGVPVSPEPLSPAPGAPEPVAPAPVAPVPAPASPARPVTAPDVVSPAGPYEPQFDEPVSPAGPYEPRLDPAAASAGSQRLPHADPPAAPIAARSEEKPKFEPQDYVVAAAAAAAAAEATGATARPAADAPTRVPAEPVSPISPIPRTANVDPVGPVAPVEPVAPAAEPYEPTSVVEPIAPFTPVEAAAPVEPVEPVEPAMPAEAASPAPRVEPPTPAEPPVPERVAEPVPAPEPEPAAVAPEPEPVTVDPIPEPVAPPAPGVEPLVASTPLYDFESFVEPEPVVASTPLYDFEAFVEPGPAVAAEPAPVAEPEPLIEAAPAAARVDSPAPEVTTTPAAEPVAPTAAAAAAATGATAAGRPPKPAKASRSKSKAAKPPREPRGRGRDAARGWLRSGNGAPIDESAAPTDAAPTGTPRNGSRDRHLFEPARPTNGRPPGPRRPAHAGSAGAPAGAEPSRAHPEHAVPERLAEPVRRLDARSVADAGLTLVALDGALAPGEEVRHLVQGWAKGLPCVVARTSRRVVVVISRFPEPLVESLHPTRTSISMYGPPGTDRVSLAVVDGRRLLEVTGIRDGDEAAALCGTPTAPTGRGRGYF